jgi:hypothetical protein
MYWPKLLERRKPAILPDPPVRNVQSLRRRLRDDGYDMWLCERLGRQRSPWIGYVSCFYSPCHLWLWFKNWDWSHYSIEVEVITPEQAKTRGVGNRNNNMFALFCSLCQENFESRVPRWIPCRGWTKRIHFVFLFHTVHVVNEVDVMERNFSAERQLCQRDVILRSLNLDMNEWVHYYYLCFMGIATLAVIPGSRSREHSQRMAAFCLASRGWHFKLKCFSTH